MLEVSGIDVFHGDVQALWGVSFTVNQGEIVTIIGSNGAGKTTTLRTISGIMHPAAGKITFEGNDITHLPAHKIVEIGIAQIPEGRKLWPGLTVAENLDLGAFHPRARGNRDRSLDRVFDLFPRLRERRSQLAGTLSGGEQQMLAIARGLMGQPRLLMLDEPSLGLAPILVEEVFRIVREINDQGVTVLLVEQNVRRTLELAHRGYVLETGRITMAGASADLLNSEHVRQAYLGL